MAMTEFSGDAVRKCNFNVPDNPNAVALYKARDEIFYFLIKI